MHLGLDNNYRKSLKQILIDVRYSTYLNVWLRILSRYELIDN